MENVLPEVSEAPYGVCHGDETFLQFQPYYIDYVADGLNEADLSVSRILLDLWKNFIKTGKTSTEGIQIFIIQIEHDKSSITGSLTCLDPQSPQVFPVS